MLEKGKISPIQAIGLMVSFILGSAILIIPSAVAATAGQDAWISMILATAAGLGIMSVYTALGYKFPGLTFVQYSKITLGTFLGKIAGLIMIWFALHLGSLVVMDSSELLNATFLPKTPEIVINTLVVLLVALAVRGGLEVVTRVNDFLLPVMAFLFLMFFVLSLSNMDINRLLPVVDRGMKPVIAGSLSAISFPFAETILLTMVMPFINSLERTKMAFLLGGMIGGAMLLLVTLMTLLVLGPGATAGLWYSSMEAVRMIDLFNIIQRVESTIIINWIGFVFMKITICFYAFVLGLSQWLNLKDYRPLILPSGVIMLALSLLLHENYVELVYFAAVITVPYILSLAFFIPILLLIVAKLRGMGERVQ